MADQRRRDVALPQVLWQHHDIEPLPYFDANAIYELVPTNAAVSALRAAFAERPTHAARAHLTTAGAEFLVMPAANGDAAGAKMVIIQPRNEARGTPVIQGLYVLFDAAGGRPLALLDGAALTLLRTPAVSALATDVLARADVHSVGVLGTGPQALAHPAAMRAVRPTVSQVVVAGRSPDRVASLVAALRDDGFDARSGTWAQAAACDLVCGCTRSSDPLISLSDLSPGGHLNLVGSYRTDLREVGADIVSHATVYVDDLAAAKAEAGELTIAIDEGRWSWGQVAGDLADIAAGNVGRQTTGEITLFKSVGLAVQDLAIAQQVARGAGLL
jgi:ornithine cyclodeaminase/alanine dehydrogenase-like protein (mu-crystallin family)